MTDYAAKVVAGEIIAGPHVRNAARRHLADLEHAHKRGLYFCPETCAHVLGFFPDVLRLTGGDFEGIPFNLQPAQQFVVGSLFGWLREDGRRRFRRAYIEQAKGAGKALALDTPIPTPAGWRTMADLRPGNRVFDEHGRPCTVTAISEVMYGRPCYRVRFSDGAEIVADEDHLWRLKSEPVPDGLWTTGEIARAPQYQHRVDHRFITACEPCASVPVKCISVDSPSRMYLAGRHFVPTHNSPLAGGIGLYMMLADGEARAEVYAAASKKDQAMILFRDAVAMREQSPFIAERVLPSGKNPVWQLTDLKTNSFFKPLANEDGQSGPRPSCALLDEVHEMRDRLMIDMMERGFKWRRQPLLFMITNSGHDRRSVCYEQHEHAVRVAAGTMTPDDDFTFVGEPIDDTTFSYVCALDRDDDPLEDRSCWIKANPLLGITMREENLEESVKQARLLPGARNEVLRLNFCVWTESDTAWMSRQALEACLHEFDPLVEHEGADVYAGIDLSAAQDLTAVGYCVETGSKTVYRDDGTRAELPTYDAWVDIWTPKDTIRERADRDRAPYHVWHEQGHLFAEPGKLIRQDAVAARLAEMASTLNLRQLAYDRYIFRQFQEYCESAGLVLPIIWHPQGGQRRAQPPDDEVEEAKKRGLKPGDTEWPEGLWMPGSLTKLEELILGERIRIRTNPALIAAFMSAVIEQDKLMGNRWLSKSKATNRIDPLIALLMAVGAATRRGLVAGGPSIYEQSGFFI